jgi:hypothetical protein
MRVFSIVIVLAFILATATFATPGDTLKSIPTPTGYTIGLAYDGHFLWSSDRRTDQLYKIDPASGKCVDSFNSPGYGISGLTFDGHWLWCVDPESALIFGVDPVTHIVERTIASPTTQTGGMAWDGKYLWILDNTANKLCRIDANDGTTITSISAPTGSCSQLVFDGTYLWTADRFSDQIYMLTPETGDVVIILHAPGQFTSGLAYDGKALWVADYQTDRIYEVAVDDGGLFSQRDTRIENMEFVHQVRNFGPDTLTDLNVFLAIPHDLNSQKILGSIEYAPKPTEIVKDKWGQEVAHWQFKGIAANQHTDVAMRVKAELYRCRYYVFPNRVGKLDQIPADIRKAYLVDDVKFSYTDPVIQNAVKAAVGTETNPYWIGRKIFKYIIDHMSYELSGGWNTAPTVLARTTGSCSEYTFVYIAMCRAVGLPARFAGAVSWRDDDASWDDVHHRWVEIYLPNYGWIPVDPSGGDNPWPANQANAIGFVDNRFVITTLGGGGSEYLDWNYDANERWTSKGKCKVVVKSFGEWTPGAQNMPATMESPTSIAPCAPR